MPGKNTPLFTLIYDVNLHSAVTWTGSCCFIYTPLTLLLRSTIQTTHKSDMH